MRRLLAIGLVGLLAAGLGAQDAQGQPDSGTGSAGQGPPLTVLLFHPDDGVDPLGFSVAGQGVDAFALRYGPLVADKGRFDFPFFVADGVLPIEAIPDPSKPYVSALAAYTQTVEQRSVVAPPATLDLSSTISQGQILVQVTVASTTDLSAEDLHVRVAVVEDHVEYQPPPGLTNGVTDHRFTVRAYADLGAPVPGPMAHTFPLSAEQGWDPGELSVAAWLQQDAPSPRFDPREVVQATHAAVGERVVQTGKGVLVEMLSATWCDPCLYGDRAVEALAVDYGVAIAGPNSPASRYLDLQARDAWSLVAAAALGILVVVAARRRPHG